jgi:hypothetical protein
MTQHPTASCCWCQSKLEQIENVWWCPQKECRTKQRESGIAFQVPTIEKGKHTGWGWTYWFTPLPSQAEFERRQAPRKLWGGAAGPGKSYGARRLAMRRCQVIPNYSVLLLRKTFPELERTHIKAMRRESQELGFTWAESRKTAEFKNGSTIECGHMEDADSVQKYLSTEYDLIIAEEGVQFQPDALMELMSRARTSNPHVIARGGAEVWIPTNPGGPSHALLRDLFITHTPDIERYPAMKTKYRAEQWCFIPAKLDDNPYLDPDYESLALSGLRKARYEQMRHGDWDAAEGMFFEDFSSRTHSRELQLAKPLTGVVEAVDWGFSSFGCVGWFVPVGDNHWHCIQEWKFKQLTAEDVARGIVKIRKDLGIKSVAYTVVDPSMHNKTGSGKGESFAETFARFKVPTRRGDNDRKMGWPRMAAWFKPDVNYVTDTHPEGVPWLTFDPSCKYLLRSIPALLCDKNDPEDIDTKLDDHGADMVRYFTQSRPSVSQISVPKTTPAMFSPNWLRSLVAPKETGVLA